MCTICSSLHPFTDGCDYSDIFGPLVPDRSAVVGTSVSADYSLASDSVFSGAVFAQQEHWGALAEVKSDQVEFVNLPQASTPLAEPLVREFAFALQPNAGRSDDSDGGTAPLIAVGYSNTAAASSTTGQTSAVSLGTGLATAAVSSLPLYTYDQIARQLTHTYWGGSAHSFAVQPGGTLNVDVSALTPEGRQLALWALDTWSAFTGIIFNTAPPVGATVQITMDDTQLGGSTAIMLLGSSVYSAHVNIGLDWLATYGTTQDSYSYYSYLHELGHALGLGHAGNYNDSAVYATNAQYLNDSWQATVMSYFDQQENTYINATYAFVMTPMIADIVAVQNLYGAPTGIRGGNTVYGEHSTAGSIYDRLGAMRLEGTLAHAVTLTIFDQGGYDTLDLRSDIAAQHIDLRPEGISDIYGQTGVLSIARGTQIERFYGGSGNDTITGNAGWNRLYGSAGNDSVRGGAGNDLLAGGNGNDRLFGEVGNDALYGSNGNDALYGNAGNDLLGGGNGRDKLVGGDGRDALYGNNGNDLLYGASGADSLWGGGGADVLFGGTGNDRLHGGPGADTLFGNGGADMFVFTHPTQSTIAARDIIADFLHGADLVNLTAIDANATLAGDQAFSFIGTAGFTAAGQLRYAIARSATLAVAVQADVNGDGIADFALLLRGVSILDGSDFLL